MCTRSPAAVSWSLIRTGLLLSEYNCLHHSTVIHTGTFFFFFKLQTRRIKITSDTNYYKQLNVHRCNISPVQNRGFKAFFCCFENVPIWVKLNSWGHRTGVSNLVTSQHDVMILLHQRNAHWAQLVAPGQFQIGSVDIRDNIAYIYGKLGCQFGVYVDQGF